jgi:membrane-associated phospholipid phosphatase
MTAARARSPLFVFVFGLFLPIAAFIFLAEEASEGERLPWDRGIAGLFDQRPGLSAARADDLVALGIWVGAILVGAVALVVAAKAKSRQVTFWTVALTGVATIALSLGVVGHWLGGAGASFPSASATVLTAAVAALVYLAGSSRRRAVVGLFGAGFVVAYGFSLVYLGWSNPSYVLAGWCVSVAWVSGLRLAIPLERPSSKPVGIGELRSFLRKLLRRQPVDDLFDWLRFRIDTFPRSVAWLQPLGLSELHDSTYHDLPWVGVRSGRRVESTRTRWEQIAPLVEANDVRAVVDRGSSAGWFGFMLAERGIPTIAVERSPRGLRVGFYTRKKSGLDDVSFLAMEVTPSTAPLLPAADCILLLSIWHHFVREWGLEAATGMLAEIWDKAGSVLFFETGEDEMPASWRLPAMLPDSRSWLTDFLGEVCVGARVVHLGEHDALGPENEPCRRNLFALVRDQQQV